MSRPDPDTPASPQATNGATATTNGSAAATNGTTTTTNGAATTPVVPVATQYAYEHYTMTIRIVDFHNARTIPLQITGDETVEMLQIMVEDASGVAVAASQLEFMTVRLLPGLYLEDYSIQDGDFVDLL